MNLENDLLKIGRSIPRPDAFTKVTGSEKYAADYYGPNMIWAGVKRADKPHARLKGLDIAEAQKLPGMLAVLTARDIRGTNRQGVVRRDQPVLVDDKVRRCGDALALVLAENKSILLKALSLIRANLDPLPAVFTIEQALEPNAPLIHPDHAGGNILLQGVLETGLGHAALADCDRTVEAIFDLPYQEHTYLETEAGWAVCSTDGHLEIIASTQTPFRDRIEVVEALGLDLQKVRIIAPYCGGAFGGKDGITVQSLLGLAALHCPGRPVKMWWGREESILAGSKRHPGRLHYRLGAKADGTLHSLDVEIYFDTGPYDHLGGAVLALALEHSGGPYRIPHTSLKGWNVYTNNPLSGAFRGFGVPQVTAAMEQMMDLLANRLNLSPLVIRQRNAVRQGDRNAVGVTLNTSTGLLECLQTLAGHELWQKREQWKSAASPFKKRGVGLACVMQGMGYGPLIPDSATAKIELTADGRFRIYFGVTDMGQGNAATYAQMAAVLLNQNIDCIQLILPDTAQTLAAGSASASRTTYTFGNALIGAVKILEQRLKQKAAELTGTQKTTAWELRPGLLIHSPTRKEITLTVLANALVESERIATHKFTAPVSTEKPTEDQNLRLHGIPHLIFSYGVHLACVELDLLTAKLEAKAYLAVSDCGRILNPQIFEQQIQGAIAQGLGYVLCEDLLVQQGRILTPDLSTYIIPTSLDIPDLLCPAIANPEPSGPFGLKGAGEIAVNGPLPAVANALADACGVRLARFPLTAVRLLPALENNHSKEKKS
ncbi:MAG: xanthine dehydrogenase family protein molybdopterin-binding subunit [Desulfobacteraceae bacterium]|nr:MAG: xanthine dehydrogenase family protein molybdopterin-binding subunit [Desulfobacteraceae bacterium]